MIPADPVRWRFNRRRAAARSVNAVMTAMLLRTRSEHARRFYETEALRAGWTVRQLRAVECEPLQQQVRADDERRFIEGIAETEAGRSAPRRWPHSYASTRAADASQAEARSPVVDRKSVASRARILP
jgi:hypothetical protein